ncbi:hypothetical protein EON82_05460 [bacterium]|nr:MAG: hypothetical protein EON82_05460 [bacterium]
MSLAIGLCLALLSPPAPLKIGMVGHSLLNHEVPQMLRTIAASRGKSVVVFEQITNGATLNANWNHHAQAESHAEMRNTYGDLREEIARARPPFDVLVLTERVAIKDAIQWEDTLGYTIKWRNHALQHNPKAKVYHYATWVGFRNGEWWKDVPDAPTWRARTVADGKLYEQVSAQAMRDPRSSKGAAIGIVPAHRAMALLFDALEAGKLPWLGRNIRAVMADDIHLKPIGNYYIACVMYGTLFKDSPVGATGVTKGIWGNELTKLSPSQAAELQRLAWKAVS